MEKSLRDKFFNLEILENFNLDDYPRKRDVLCVYKSLYLKNYNKSTIYYKIYLMINETFSVILRERGRQAEFLSKPTIIKKIKAMITNHLQICKRLTANSCPKKFMPYNKKLNDFFWILKDPELLQCVKKMVKEGKEETVEAMDTTETDTENDNEEHLSDTDELDVWKPNDESSDDTSDEDTGSQKFFINTDICSMLDRQGTSSRKAKEQIEIIGKAVYSHVHIWRKCINTREIDYQKVVEYVISCPDKIGLHFDGKRIEIDGKLEEILVIVGKGMSCIDFLFTSFNY